MSVDQSSIDALIADSKILCEAAMSVEEFLAELSPQLLPVPLADEVTADQAE